MKTETLAIDDLKQLEKNPRKHGESQIKELVRSVEQFGQYRPLVVDETDTILAGNGLHLALKEAGVDKVSVYRMKNLTEEQKKKLILADNRTGDLSNDDFAVIEDILAELEDFQVPGYDEELLRELVMSADDAVEKSNAYGYFSEEDRQKLNERSGKAEEDHSAARETVGNPPEPMPVLAEGSGEAPQSEASGQDSEVCPTCGKAW